MSIADDTGPVPLDWPYWDMAEDPNKLTCKKFFEDWSGVHDNIHIWDYTVNFSHYLAPMPNMEVIQSNIHYFIKHGVKGIMTQGNYQTSGGERELMRCWVIAKLLWNPSRDVRELMRDFTYGYYGKAAPEIDKYNQMLWQIGKQKELLKKGQRIRYSMDVEWLSNDFLERAKPIFDKAQALAENDEIRSRVELDRLPVMYVELSQLHKQLKDTNKIPDKEYFSSLLEQFVSIANRNNVTHRGEGIVLSGWIEELEKDIAKYQE